MNETNGELFHGLPESECGATLDGKHLYERDEDTRIKMPGSNFKKLSYRRRLGGTEYEYYNGKCLCGDVKRMEITV